MKNFNQERTSHKLEYTTKMIHKLFNYTQLILFSLNNQCDKYFLIKIIIQLSENINLNIVKTRLKNKNFSLRCSIQVDTLNYLYLITYLGRNNQLYAKRILLQQVNQALFNPLQNTKWQESLRLSVIIFFGIFKDIAFIIEPICKLANSIIEGNMDITNKMFYVLGLELTQEEQKLSGIYLLKAVMSKWINAVDILIEMIICIYLHLWRYKRIEHPIFFECPLNNTIPLSMKECDFKEPLILLQGVFQQISQSYLRPNTEKSGFFSFGRIFSGTIRTSIIGQRIFKKNTDDGQISKIHIRCSLWLYCMIRMLSYQGGVQYRINQNLIQSDQRIIQFHHQQKCLLDLKIQKINLYYKSV
ncbi:unnamed protein product [Paramecium pentaurelia]|uniref:Uncharacterized protein n=1 Tax=Paramecium pentaurelia TaxID=43138 RepID=A0A8S1VBZ1_9CILI|nr:unnamed protein product [Paramecium pentaurelia]